jgi:hypothetical protein
LNSQEAKQILLLYRPGSNDLADPQMTEALNLAGRDPELGRWFEQHRAFQNTMRAKFRSLEAPAHLKASLLIRASVQSPISTAQPWWRKSSRLTAAAFVVVLLLIGLAGIWLKPRTPDRFANFRDRMVGTALREYRMDLVTNDMRQVRQFLAEKGAPADYDLTAGLQKLELTGTGLLRWRSNPVSMVCFNRGDNQMVFLFVMKRSALKDAPAEIPALTKVANLMTASWSHGDEIYLLAGEEEADFARKYLPPKS